MGDCPADTAVLGDGRLREVYYAILKGDAGDSARRAFGVGNEIARTIEYLSSRLDETVTIDELAAQVGMSRAVFHRKFKQATTMSPIQFVKSMRLNTAAWVWGWPSPPMVWCPAIWMVSPSRRWRYRRRGCRGRRATGC